MAPHAAGLSFLRFAYRNGCTSGTPDSSQHLGHASHDARDVHSESYKGIKWWGLENILQKDGKQLGDKLVVRPTAVDRLSVHFLIAVQEGYELASRALPGKLIYVKHIRRYLGSDECEDLTTDEPPDFLPAI